MEDATQILPDVAGCKRHVDQVGERNEFVGAITHACRETESDSRSGLEAQDRTEHIQEVLLLLPQDREQYLFPTIRSKTQSTPQHA